MYILPNNYDGVATNREVDTSASALFFVSSNGYVVVHDDSTVTNWVELTTTMGGGSYGPLTNDKMVRVTAYLDYNRQDYALFVDGLCLQEGIGFVGANASYTTTVIKDDAYVDDLYVSATSYPDGVNWNGNAKPLESDEDNDGMLDAWELEWFGTIAGTLPSADPDGDDRNNSQEENDGTDPTDGTDASWAIPYYEKFAEAALGNFTGEWHALTNLTGVGAVKVTGTETVIAASPNAMEVSAGALELSLDDNTASNVFVQLYIKPVVCPALPSSNVVDDATAAICVLDVGAPETNLYVWSDTNWVACDTISIVPTNGTWIGLASHVNYNESKWDLYVSTTGNFATHMDKAHSTKLDFNVHGAYTYFNSLIVSNESPSTALVDCVAVSLSYTNCIDSYTNLAIFERLEGKDTATTIPPYLYSAAQDGLDSQLGWDMSIGLVHGDQIQVLKPTGWYAYKLDVDKLWQYVTGPTVTYDPGIDHATGIRLVRQAGDDTLAFYPYEATVAGTASTKVFGSGDAIYNGRTDLALPSTYSTCVDINQDLTPAAPGSLGFDGLASDGDQLLFYEADTSTTVKFFYSGAPAGDWVRMSTGVVELYPVCPGDAFMYYNSSASEFTWVIVM